MNRTHGYDDDRMDPNGPKLGSMIKLMPPPCPHVSVNTKGECQECEWYQWVNSHVFLVTDKRWCDAPSYTHEEWRLVPYNETEGFNFEKGRWFHNGNVHPFSLEKFQAVGKQGMLP